MNTNTISAIETVVGTYGKQATAASTAQAIATLPTARQEEIRAQAAGAAIGALQVTTAVAEAMGKSLPLVGTGLAIGSLDLNFGKVIDGAQAGEVKKADVRAAAADVAGLLSSLAFAGAAAAGVATAPILVGAGVALVVASAALTVAAMAAGDDTINTPELKEMNDAAKKFLDEAGAVGKAITDALLDPDFWDGFVEQGAKIFDPLLDPLNEAGHWIGQNLPIPQEIKDNVKTYFDRAKDWVARPLDPLSFDLDGDGLETVGIATSNAIQFDHTGDGTKNGTGWISSDDGMLVLDRNGNGTIDNGRELFGDSTIKSNGLKATDGFDALADIDSLSNGGNADGIINNQDTQFSNLRIWRDLNQDGVSQTGELFTLASLNISSLNTVKTSNLQLLTNGNQLADTGSYTITDSNTGIETSGHMGDVNLAADTFNRTYLNTLDTSSVAHLPDMQGSGAVRDFREVANDHEWRVAA